MEKIYCEGCGIHDELDDDYNYYCSACSSEFT